MNERERIDERRERLLDEWLAGDLAPGSDAERALLAHDPGLLDELERHRALRAAVRELPAELEPGRDLWPGVAARIAPAARPPRRVLPWRAATWRSAVAIPAAALAATIAVAVGTVLLRHDRTPKESPPSTAALAPRPAVEPAPETAPSMAPRMAPEAEPSVPAADRRAAAPPATRLRLPAAPRSTPTPAELAAAPPGPDLGTTGGGVPALAAYAETDRQLAALGAELRRTIDAQQDRLPPATRRIVFDNLATIERALAEIEVALAGAPGDVELARTYIEYRQREITVLRRANAMAARL